MWDTIFMLAAVIGGTVVVFQFVLMLLGLTHHNVDLGGGHHVDLSGGIGGDHAVGGDLSHHGGWDHSTDAGTGHESAGSWFYEVISIRTLSAAATFFGLAGMIGLSYGYSPLHSFVLATVAGAAALYAVYWLYKQAYRMQHAGNENVRNAIGVQATVYVPIPGKRAGTGKVMFRLQNRVVEYQAVTDDDQRLATGEKVVVVAILNSDTVRVGRAETKATDSPAPVHGLASDA
jgi:hypothetical protein